MIAKITRMATAKGLAEYLHGVGRNEEHVYAGKPGGAVIGGTVGELGVRDGSKWAKTMHVIGGRRSDIKKTIWHCSLRNPPIDRILSDVEWADAAQSLLEELGADHLPWVAVRHGEDHIHVAVCRIADDGTVWKGSHDRRRAQRACAEIEEQLGLAKAPRRRDHTSVQAADSQITQGEYGKAQREGKAPQRVVLTEKVTAARDAAKGMGTNAFEAECSTLGVVAVVNKATTGTISGYRFQLAEESLAPGEEALTFKASQLHKGLAWKALGAALGNHNPEPPPRTVTAVPAVVDQKIEQHHEVWRTRRTVVERLRDAEVHLRKFVSELRSAWRGRPLTAADLKKQSREAYGAPPSLQKSDNEIER